MVASALNSWSCIFLIALIGKDRSRQSRSGSQEDAVLSFSDCAV
jgi:hypothetical protein